MASTVFYPEDGFTTPPRNLEQDLESAISGTPSGGDLEFADLVEPPIAKAIQAWHWGLTAREVPREPSSTLSLLFVGVCQGSESLNHSITELRWAG